MLRSTRIIDQQFSDISNSFLINSAGPVISSEIILASDTNARIFIIGSESARKGSYDFTYAMAKSSLSTYIRNRRVSQHQQLLLISPSTISDFGMTTRRSDISRLNSYKLSHPKNRFLSSSELSEFVKNLFFSTVYITNTEVEINGGKFALLD